MPTHADDLDGLDDYDRKLVSEMDDSRPLYAPAEVRAGEASLVEDVSRASASHVWGALPAIAALPPSEGFERLTDAFRAAFLAFFDARSGWCARQQG